MEAQNATPKINLFTDLWYVKAPCPKVVEWLKMQTIEEEWENYEFYGQKVHGTFDAWLIDADSTKWSIECTELTEAQFLELAYPKPEIAPESTTPSHYPSVTYEPVKVIREWNLNFNLGNVVKYVSHHGKKDGNTAIDDLKKALDYLTKEIAHLENEQK